MLGEHSSCNHSYGRRLVKQVDLVIVGAGIMGLAHAVHAARAGMSVIVFDRSPQACGASIQNFGMLAIIAQAAGKQLDDARRALAIWQEIAPQTGVRIRPAGCVIVARKAEEMSVLEEFASSAENSDHNATLVAQNDMVNYSSALKFDNILGGLYSPDVWKVDQREATIKIADWLSRKHNVTFHFSTQVHGVSGSSVETSIGTFKAGHTVICGGDEFVSLFPDAFLTAGVTRCQLQMLRTHPQSGGWKLQPFVLGGLSIPRYSVFASCKSLPDLIENQKKHYKTHLDHGIHVIICQEPDGSITIGDSHSYGDSFVIKRSMEIDQLMLDELAGMISLPDTRIADRWLGHYAHLPGTDVLKLSPTEGVTAVTVANGQGMTHAFAIAQDVIQGLHT
jgi:FAD dependent oxidoreductase TIGR03364